MRSNRVGTVVVAAACSALMAACGSSGSKGAAPTTAANPAHDRAAAQKLVLVPGDLPAGWASSLHAKDPTDAEVNQRMATCTGATDPTRQSVNVDGDDFDKGDAQAGSSVGVAATRADFEQDVAAIKSSKLVPCFKSVFSDEMNKEIAQDKVQQHIVETLDSFDVQRVSSPTYGDATVAIRAVFRLSAQGRHVAVYVDVFQFGKSRSEVELTFTNTGAAFDPALEHSLVQKAAAKLSEAA